VRPALLSLLLLSCMDPGQSPPGVPSPAGYEPAPPSRVVLVDPQGGEIVSGTIEVRAAIESPESIEAVTILVNGESIATLRAAPFAVEMDTTTLGDGIVDVRAVARWQDGTVERDAAAVRVDNHEPSVEILEPSDGDFRFVEDAPFRFSVRAEDGSQLTHLLLLAGDEVVADIAPLRTDHVVLVDPASLYPADAVDAVHVTLQAEATDALGRVGTSSIAVNVRSRLAWRFDTLGRIETAPVVLPDGGVAVGSFDGRLYVVNSDGTERCRAEGGDEVVGAPALSPDGTQIVWGTTRRLRAADPATCAIRWTHATEAIWRAGPTIAPDGTIYAATFTGTLHAISPAGATRWTFDLGGESIAPPTVAPDGTVLAGSFSGILHAIAPDGTPRWQFETGAEIGAPALATDDAIYVGSYDFYLYALSHDGREIWEYPFATDADVQCAPDLLPRGDVAFCSRDGHVYAARASDGSEKWRFETAGLTYGGVVVGKDGSVYAGAADGTLHALGPDGSPRWSFETFEAIVARPATGAGMVFVPSADRRLYALWADGTPEGS